MTTAQALPASAWTTGPVEAAAASTRSRGTGLPAGRLLGTLWGPRCYEDGEDLP